MQNERPELPLIIARIARSATPVTPLDPPLVRLLRWSMASTLVAVAGVALFGARADAVSQLFSPWFAARAAATLALTMGAGAGAILMSVPGLEPPLLRRFLWLSGGIGWAVLLLGAMASEASPYRSLLATSPHPRCVVVMVMIALPAAVWLMRSVRDGMPLQPRAAATFAALASLALGAIGSQFACAIDAAPHHVLWHFTPLVLLTIGASSIGRRLLCRPHR